MAQDTLPPDTVRQVNPLDDSGWDARILNYPNYSFFHGAAWTRVLADTYGFTPFYFATNDALVPLMEVDSWLTGKRAISLPFTDECEPLGESVGPVATLLKNAIEFGRSRGWRYIEIRGGRKRFGDTSASLAYYGHRLELTPDESRMFEKMDGSTRQAIRKAEKNGVTVTISSSLEAIQPFYSLQCKTRKRHGLPPQPFLFFLNIQKHILSQNQGIIVTASHDNRAIASSVYFHLGRRAIFKYGASDAAFQSLRGTSLVMWEAMKWLARNGVTMLHLGKTALTNEGLRRFKLHCGATENTIEYAKFDMRQDRYVAGTDEISGWHNRVFRAMPPFASRLAGRLLYKHWA